MVSGLCGNEERGREGLGLWQGWVFDVKKLFMTLQCKKLSKTRLLTVFDNFRQSKVSKTVINCQKYQKSNFAIDF